MKDTVAGPGEGGQFNVWQTDQLAITAFGQHTIRINGDDFADFFHDGDFGTEPIFIENLFLLFNEQDDAVEGYQLVPAAQANIMAALGALRQPEP